MVWSSFTADLRWLPSSPGSSASDHRHAAKANSAELLSEAFATIMLHSASACLQFSLPTYVQPRLYLKSLLSALASEQRAWQDFRSSSAAARASASILTKDAYRWSANVGPLLSAHNARLRCPLLTSGRCMAAEKTIFYAVYVPERADESNYVFLTLDEAMACAQKFSDVGARFKAFTVEAEARIFCASGREREPHKSRCSSIGEPSSCFSKPTPSELFALRQDIEQFRTRRFVEKVLSNPRFLVSQESDSAAILHAGCRYNALHLAARCGNYDVCEFVLNLLDDGEYVKRLFPGCTPETVENGRRFILDSYLNTPDKLLNATPLYLAAKFGHVSVVRLLTSYKECDKCRPSALGLLPVDVVCESVSSADPDVKRSIQLYVGPISYYVPLYREGRHRDSEVFVLKPPCRELPVQSFRVSKDVPTEFFIDACGGPFANEVEAGKFYNSWLKMACFTMKPKMDCIGLCSTDSLREMESMGRKLAGQVDCPWAEYWHFLKSFCDLRTHRGLSKFNWFLRRRHVLLCNLKNVSPELPNDSDAPAERATDDEAVRELTAPMSNVILDDEPMYRTPPESPCKISFAEIGGVEAFCATSEASCLPFIHGELPLKTDYDAFEAVRFNNNLSDYPFVQRWFDRTSAYPEQEMVKWAPVGSPRERTMRFKISPKVIRRRLFNNPTARP
uniref:ANKLE2 third alpha/beta domain-containing protein n=1 Tax=Trichuris muris TaxID=70415 RepID=A0A5S6Q7J0_TRIMR